MYNLQWSVLLSWILTLCNNAFEESFLFWDEIHFDAVQRSVITKLRNFLVKHGVKIRMEQRLPISRALAEYVDQVWRREVKNDAEVHDDDANKKDKNGVAIATNQSSPDPIPIDVEEDIPIVSMNQFMLTRLKDTCLRTSHARLADVSKLFPRDLKYSGNSIEPLRRRFQTFKNAVGLCNIDLENTAIMFPLLETSFLKGQALHHYQDNIRNTAKSVQDVIDRLETTFSWQQGQACQR